MNPTVRIIGGRFRGKKIPFRPVEGLRPTPDRVRETVFNWLMHTVRGAHCLDAFAGSGAFGFEAYSRDAEKVVLVEQNPVVYQQLCNVAKGFATTVDIVNADAKHYLKTTKQQFDLVFLDPPFAQHDWETCLSVLAEQQVLIPDGLVYVESPQILSLDTMQWETVKLQRAGQVFYGLFRKITKKPVDN